MRGRLLVAGTTSDAGKTVVVTGLCRLLAREGVRVAPFKAQNMSNNSMVCRMGEDQYGEMGRAQWIQAIASMAEPEVAMNPVLLKPGSDLRSHVVVMGEAAGVIDASNFQSGRHDLARAAFAAFDDLASRFDVVIAEGAGSPAEINLRDGDFVNMGLAQHGDIPTIVVGDIDRGGVFAALYGTLALLSKADQRLIRGFVLNKFRGEQALLRPAIDALAERTGRPTVGIVPWHPDLWLDSEDSLDTHGRRSIDEAALRVAVIRLPRLSNFTDIDALGVEPGVDVRFASRPRDVADADLIVLPGTRATIADLAWLRTVGLDRAIAEHAGKGLPVLGICGGYQMLGQAIVDPYGVEGNANMCADGLGLLDLTTVFEPAKTVRLTAGSGYGHRVEGYEIHHGRVECHSGSPFPGGVRSGNVFGTVWHGALESDGFRAAWLAEAAQLAGSHLPTSSVRFADQRMARVDLIADLLRDHVNVPAVCDIVAGKRSS